MSITRVALSQMRVRGLLRMDDGKMPRYDFMELRTRAEFVELCGDEQGAAELRDLSLQIAREVDLTCYAYQLLWRDRIEDAIALMELNAAANPESSNVYDSLGEMWEAAGDARQAVDCYRRAADLVADEKQGDKIAYAIKRLTGLERAAS